MLISKNSGTIQIFSKPGKYNRWRIISILIVGIMIGSAFYTTNFIYKNIYTTLANANTIIVLSSSLVVDAVDIKNYNLAEAKKKEKATVFAWPKDLRVIFNYENTSSSTSSTTR